MNFHTNTLSQNARLRYFSKLLALPFPLRAAGFVASLVLVITTAAIGFHLLDENYFVGVPAHGGKITEGVVGKPHQVNPIIAKNEADRDLSALIYSGLLRPAGNGLEPDLAVSYTVSPDGRTYTVALRQDAKFHDDKPVTSDDVLFTIDRIKSKSLPTKSPLAVNFNGVTVTADGPYSVVFTLDKPLANFPESLTFGILPKHIWGNVSTTDFDQVSADPKKMIGSGPFRVQNVVPDADGSAKEYVLRSFKNYVHGEPFIDEFDMYFYGNEQDRMTAYKGGEIAQIAGPQTQYAREIADSGAPVLAAPMPRVFGVFFNQSKAPVLADLYVRAALDFAVPREDIRARVFYGYATPEVGPFPGVTLPIPDPFDKRLLMAKTFLEKTGWTLNDQGIYQKTNKKTKQTQTLTFSISLPDIPELKQSADVIVAGWRSLGAQVTLKTFELGSFTSDILTNRNYDAVFFGQATGRDPDPSAFWGSKEKQNGTNIALYDDKTVDATIDQLSATTDATTRTELLAKINEKVMADHPAVFAYSPQFVYAIGRNTHGVKLPLMTTTAERFSGIEKWYVTEERVWKFLQKDNG